MPQRWSLVQQVCEFAGASLGSAGHMTLAQMPFVGRCVQTEGLLEVQLKPDSGMQVGVQPSPETTLP